MNKNMKMHWDSDIGYIVICYIGIGYIILTPVFEHKHLENAAQLLCLPNYYKSLYLPFRSCLPLFLKVENVCLIAASSSQPAIIALLFFYNSKNLNCIGALSFFFFFKICSHIFMIFEVKLE